MNAEQATAIVQQSHEVTQAANEWVQQDAAARRELLQAQQELQQSARAERTDLDRERREIDQQRAAAAEAAIREPVIGQAILTVGLALAALVPFVLTALALRQLPARSDEALLLDEFLIHPWVAGNQSDGEAVALAASDCAQPLIDTDAPPDPGQSA